MMDKKSILMAILLTLWCRLSEQSPNFYRKIQRFQETDPEPNYDGCGVSYQCFGIDDGCVDSKTCTVLLKTQPIESGAQFDLYWKRDGKSSEGWVAAALSEDQKMGDDSATMFIINKDNTVDHVQGFTYCDNGYGVTEPVNVTGIRNTKTQYENGLLFGEWIRDEDTEVQHKSFNLKTTKYYIFLAMGPLDEHGNPKQHDKKSVSKDAVSLEQLIVTSPTPPTPATSAGSTGTSASTGSTGAGSTASPGSTEKPGTSTTSGTTEGTGTPKGTTSRPISTTPSSKSSSSSVMLSIALFFLAAIKLIF